MFGLISSLSVELVVVVDEVAKVLVQREGFVEELLEVVVVVVDVVVLSGVFLCFFNDLGGFVLILLLGRAGVVPSSFGPSSSSLPSSDADDESSEPNLMPFRALLADRASLLSDLAADVTRDFFLPISSQNITDSLLFRKSNLGLRLALTGSSDSFAFEFSSDCFRTEAEAVVAVVFGSSIGSGFRWTGSLLMNVIKGSLLADLFLLAGTRGGNVMSVNSLLIRLVA